MEAPESRLREAAIRARDAEERGAHWEANEWWERHRLIEDAGRDPFDLFARGVALNRAAETMRGAVKR